VSIGSGSIDVLLNDLTSTYFEGELDIRPIDYQLEHRVEAHILVAFLAYCLTMTPQAVLQKLGAIQMPDLWLPTADGRWLVMPLPIG
jgi:hypothetical protein